MVKYEVNFREEPMLYFGLEVNKEGENKVSKQRSKGIERGQLVYIARTGELNLKTNGLLYREGLYKSNKENKNDKVEYRMEVTLGDLKRLVEEVIDKDTGVEVKGKVELWVDFFSEKLGVLLREDYFNKEENRKLKEYHNKGLREIKSIVVIKYLEDLGYKVNEGEVSVYCDTEKEEDFERFMCTVRVK